MKIHYYKGKGIMPIEVDEKLILAKCFLNQLKELKKKYKKLVLVDPIKLSCLLEGFLFEVIAAKDAFLCHLNHITGNLLEDWQVNEKRLLREYKKQKRLNEIEIIEKIIKLKEEKNSWLWKLNSYRNTVAHRLVLKRYIKFRLRGELSKKKPTEIKFTDRMKFLSGDMFQITTYKLKNNTNLISVGEVFLLKNPKDYYKNEEGPPGEAGQEIFSYCNESLKKMRKFLEELSKKIEIK